MSDTDQKAPPQDNQTVADKKEEAPNEYILAVNKRLRALKKKQAKVAHIEELLKEGAKINKDQRETYDSRDAVAKTMKELEEIRTVMTRTYEKEEKIQRRQQKRAERQHHEAKSDHVRQVVTLLHAVSRVEANPDLKGSLKVSGSELAALSNFKNSLFAVSGGFEQSVSRTVDTLAHLFQQSEADSGVGLSYKKLHETLHRVASALSPAPQQEAAAAQPPAPAEQLTQPEATPAPSTSEVKDAAPAPEAPAPSQPAPEQAPAEGAPAASTDKDVPTTNGTTGEPVTGGHDRRGRRDKNFRKERRGGGGGRGPRRPDVDLTAGGAPAGGTPAGDAPQQPSDGFTPAGRGGGGRPFRPRGSGRPRGGFSGGNEEYRQRRPPRERPQGGAGNHQPRQHSAPQPQPAQ